VNRGDRDVEAARQRLVDHARETILADVDTADPFYEAFNRLAGHAGAFLDAPAGHDTKRPHRRRRAKTATLVLTLMAGGVAVGATGVIVATKTDLLDLTGITKTDASVPPSPSPTPVVIVAPNLDPRDLPLTHAPSVDVKAIVDQVIADLAAQRQAEADAAAAAAAAQQPSAGNTGGSTSSGGKTGGTSNGGGGAAPPPAPAAYVSSISFHATTGTGVINITANITTSGSMSVGVSCTAGGVNSSSANLTVY
jgi:uncharacterized membrane protein YgcG